MALLLLRSPLMEIPCCWAANFPIKGSKFLASGHPEELFQDGVHLNGYSSIASIPVIDLWNSVLQPMARQCSSVCSEMNRMANAISMHVFFVTTAHGLRPKTLDRK